MFSLGEQGTTQNTRKHHFPSVETSSTKGKSVSLVHNNKILLEFLKHGPIDFDFIVPEINELTFYPIIFYNSRIS